MIYVVLGMHKSGTTLVSQILHKSGISMGEFDEDVAYDEQGGQWERRESFLINLDIVGTSEQDFFSLDHYAPRTPPVHEDVLDAMDGMIGRCVAREDDWGFKDPLTCLTYAQWAEVLPTHRLVGVYRNPEEIMHHYRYGALPYDPVLGWRVLRAWTSYNQCMLEALRGAGDAGICIRYEELMRGDEEFQRLERFLGRPLTDMRHASRHRARSGHPLYRPVAGLMSRLTARDPARTLAELDELRRSQL